MMEHTTDRLFWTLTSIVVGALILTIGINAFPKATQHMLHPVGNVAKQADTTTNTANNATKHATDFSFDDHNTSSDKQQPQPSNDKSKKDDKDNTHTQTPSDKHSDSAKAPSESPSNPTGK